MEISINPQSDLTRGNIESLLRLIDTPDKRRKVLTDLCTLRENLEGLFGFESSPLVRETAHPLFKILLTSNEIIGSLLLNDSLVNRHSKYGEIVEVVEERAGHLHTSTPPHLNPDYYRFSNYPIPQQVNTRLLIQ